VIGIANHLHRSDSHSFSKRTVDELVLVAGMGVEGDAHFGATVKHRSRVLADPLQPNLRQVHFMHSELHDELRAEGFSVGPGDLGENITTTGLDLLSLPVGTVLRIGAGSLVTLTGLRNPCSQIEAFERGLLKQVLARHGDGRVVRKTGVMGVVVLGGTVHRGDTIHVALPPEPHTVLDRV
jgi:MOSC domain-containing protein YiiM